MECKTALTTQIVVHLITHQINIASMETRIQVVIVNSMLLHLLETKFTTVNNMVDSPMETKLIAIFQIQELT